MPQSTNRTARLEARITRDALAVVRRAAEIQGRSVSDFVVAAAQEAAQRTVAEVEVIRLSREAQGCVRSLLTGGCRGRVIQTFRTGMGTAQMIP